MFSSSDGKEDEEDYASDKSGKNIEGAGSLLNFKQRETGGLQPPSASSSSNYSNHESELEE